MVEIILTLGLRKCKYCFPALSKRLCSLCLIQPCCYVSSFYPSHQRIWNSIYFMLHYCTNCFISLHFSLSHSRSCSLCLRSSKISRWHLENIFVRTAHFLHKLSLKRDLFTIILLSGFTVKTLTVHGPENLRVNCVFSFINKIRCYIESFCPQGGCFLVGLIPSKVCQAFDSHWINIPSREWTKRGKWIADC